jgi:hypothetical protein
MEKQSDQEEEILNQTKQIWIDWLTQHHQQQESEEALYEGQNQKHRRQTTQLLTQIQARTVDGISERIFGNWTVQEPVDEYDSYLQEPPRKEQENCLAWWSDPVRQDRWPLLSVFAISVLAIPPMSDEAERVFSGARRTISWERSRLEPDIIEATECYHHFLKIQ